MIEIEIEGTKIYKSAQDICEIIIKKIIKNTEDFIAEKGKGIKIKKAIFTVPAQFREHQKKELFEAAKKAASKKTAAKAAKKAPAKKTAAKSKK